MDKQVRKLSLGNRRPFFFYKDRVLRIFPLYFAVLLLATPFFTGTPGEYAQNILLVPLNYATFTKVPVAVGPAWSLACEFQFYVLAPCLVWMPLRGLRLTAISSALLFTVSPVLPNSTFWGYTSLPGILFVFCSGMLLARNDIRFYRAVWIAALPLLAFFLVAKVFHWRLPVGIHINVLIGLALFLPVIFKLSRYKPASKLDKTLGLFSYPLFLCHEPVRTYANAWLHLDNPAILLGISLCIAGLLIVMIENPFDHLRYGIRRVNK